jgi:twitching motility protein PilU
MTLEGFFRLMADRRASDLYLAADAPATLRIHGVCVPLSQERLSVERVRSLLGEYLNDGQWAALERDKELNLGLAASGLGTFRVSAFIQRGLPSAVIRHVPAEVPAIDTLGLPEALKQMALEKSGLVLVVGAAGSGKSTTIASMLDHRNTLMTGHVLTFEEPIEYLFRNKKSIVNQRELGRDAPDLSVALANALRQAPDVLFLGEIHDPPTMAAALNYALAGHLVVATMHAVNSVTALARVASFYPPEMRQMMLKDLAVALRAVVALRLVRGKSGPRLPAAEILMNTGHTSDLIERGDLSAIKEALASSLAPQSRTFEQSLYELLQKDAITRAEALAQADSQNELLWMINNAGRPATKHSLVPDPQTAQQAVFSEFALNV